MDYTIKSYKSLLESLVKSEYSLITFKDFASSSENKSIVLRHDVDLLPQKSLRFAKIQAELGIQGSYYFRAVPESWDERIIKEIADLGHEVGYHYENMDVVSAKMKKKSGLPYSPDIYREGQSRSDKAYNRLIDLAYEDFCINLEKLRKLVTVSTICMHGSPRSKFDNKEIWKKYDYKSLGLIGEPYYDVDFDRVFYLTDTGRRWDGWKTSVRDKVPQQEEWIKQGLVFHSTQDIIETIQQQTTNNKQQILNKIMFTMHPQRWHDNTLPWVKELVMQNTKNKIKKVIYVSKKD